MSLITELKLCLTLECFFFIMTALTQAIGNLVCTYICIHTYENIRSNKENPKESMRGLEEEYTLVLLSFFSCLTITCIINYCRSYYLPEEGQNLPLFSIVGGQIVGGGVENSLKLSDLV